jgi:hypothetical protein
MKMVQDQSLLGRGNSNPGIFHINTDMIILNDSPGIGDRYDAGRIQCKLYVCQFFV